MKSTQITPDVSRDFIDFLSDSDLVKFSKFKPDVESSNLLWVQAQHIVERTRPVEPISEMETGENPDTDTSSGTGFSTTGNIHTSSEVIA
jgi:hypothetical protein